MRKLTVDENAFNPNYINYGTCNKRSHSRFCGLVTFLSFLFSNVNIYNVSIVILKMEIFDASKRNAVIYTTNEPNYDLSSIYSYITYPKN